MKSIIAFFLFSSAAIVAGGCGGSHTNDRLPNLYEGSWAGTWSGPEDNDSGTFSLKIDAYGNVTGTMSRDPSSAITGTIGGIVTGTGKLTATTTFTTSGNFTISGQMAETSSGDLNGTFTYWWNGTLYNGTFTMTASTSSG